MEYVWKFPVKSSWLFIVHIFVDYSEGSTVFILFDFVM